MPIRNILVISVKKLLQIFIMLYAVVYAINGWCIFLAITYLDLAIENFRKTVHLGIVRVV